MKGTGHIDVAVEVMRSGEGGMVPMGSGKIR
jgi:hypothetical protein